jgi:hypothetical protein
MSVDGPDDDLVLRELPETADDEPAAVAGRVVAVVRLIYVDKPVVLRTEIQET